MVGLRATTRLAGNIDLYVERPPLFKHSQSYAPIDQFFIAGAPSKNEDHDSVFRTAFRPFTTRVPKASPSHTIGCGSELVASDTSLPDECGAADECGDEWTAETFL